jgi:hypothetical protein
LKGNLSFHSNVFNGKPFTDMARPPLDNYCLQ